MTTAAVGSTTTGDAIASSDTHTAQFAVPPRISGPVLEGSHDTALPSSLPGVGQESADKHDTLTAETCHDNLVVHDSTLPPLS